MRSDRHEVKRAIILAAGIGKRMRPITCDADGKATATRTATFKRSKGAKKPAGGYSKVAFFAVLFDKSSKKAVKAIVPKISRSKRQSKKP